MEKIATDIYTFENLRTAGYRYVDKTESFYPLVNDSCGRQFFIARPRRFGKSLLIATLRSLFEGRRDLFRGLAIEPKWDWSRKWPVIHLDMGSCQADTVEVLWDKIHVQLMREAERHGVAIRDSATVASQFMLLIDDVIAAADRRAKAENPKASVEQVVLLVDEYDKPLLAKLGTDEVTVFKNALKEFYSVIKTQEKAQRFALITGVSKFSKVSIFSDLNNLTDITMDAQFATLFGYTHEEVKVNFPEHLAALAEANGLTGEEAFAKLEEMYDGFKFEENAERVFNPVSVGKCLSQKKFGNFWFETGTPTFLINLLKREPLAMGDLHVSTGDLSAAYEPEQVRMLPLMVQTGYLTIKSSTVEGRVTDCELGYPNGEVEESMSKHLALGYSCLPDDDFGDIFREVCEGLREGEPDTILEGLKCFFENIPYDLHVRYEKYYQSLFYSVFLMLKARVASEVKTSRGRIDAVVETPKFVYVFEFKLRGTSEEALAQIDEKGYADRFASDPRKLFKIGCAFDWEKHNLGQWLVA